MEFGLARSIIAFASKRIGTTSFDVWEESSLGGLPFKYAASFMTEVDARFFLAAKYPHAVEKVIVENTSNGDEETASKSSVPRPKPLHGPRDNDAWPNREDRRPFRATTSCCLIPKRQKQEKPSLLFRIRPEGDAA